MRWLLVVALVCTAWALIGAEAFAAGEDAARGMSEAEEIIGTLLSAQVMQDADDLRWQVGKLRVDEAGAHRRAVGEVLTVRYPARRGGFRGLGPGAQLLLHARRESAGPNAEIWVAPTPPRILGRGEFIQPGEGAVADLGSPKAKILVKMLAPLGPECHERTVSLLRELATAEPEKVRVQIFDMATEAGRREILRERLNCATVLVSNRYEFTLTGTEGERKVVFHNRPSMPQSTYRSEDVVAVVRQEIQRLYP